MARPDIILTETKPEDLNVFFEFQLDEEANKMAAFTAKDPSDRVAYIEKYSKFLSDPVINNRTIKLNDEIVGVVSKYVMHGDAHVTYWIDRKHWGKGIATEALWQFLMIETARPLYGHTAFDNAGSQRVLEKCGFRKVGTDKGFANARNAEIEETIYSIPSAFDGWVRTRPGMYFGDNRIKGALELICGIIKDCIFICKTDKLFVTFERMSEGRFSMKFSSEEDISIIVSQLNDSERDTSIYFLRSLKSVSSTFECIAGKNELSLNFKLDNLVFIDVAIDYQSLMDEFVMVALLNRGIEILLKDSIRKCPDQNYIHFPDGIFYMYERIKRDTLGTPQFELFYEGEIKGNKYQIVIAYRTDWYNQPVVQSYANDVYTVKGGSLVAGVLDGLLSGTRKYAAGKGLENHKIKRKKFLNGLIIVCAVRGENFEYGGSVKESLESKEVKSQSKRVVAALVHAYLNDNPALADTLLSRFDEGNMMSKMYG